MKKIILLLLLTAVGVSAQSALRAYDTNGAITWVRVTPDGNLSVSPYQSFVRSTDTWGAAKDTSTYDFGNDYLKAYVTVYDSSATADTLVFEVYSHAKLGWTTQMIGFKDVVTGYSEADNSTVIIGGTLAKKFEITKYRPGQVRVRPKTLTGRTTFKTKRIVWEGIN